MGKFKTFEKKTWVKIAGGVLGVAVIGGVAWNQLQYTNQHNISKSLTKEITAYLAQEEKEYLVYFYDKDVCETCDTYTNELKQYEKKEGALPVYKATAKDQTTLAFENDLFIDKRYPILVHVKDGEEYYRYVGTHPIDALPVKEAPKKEQATEVPEQAPITTPPAKEEVAKPVAPENENVDKVPTTASTETDPKE